MIFFGSAILFCIKKTGRDAFLTTSLFYLVPLSTPLSTMPLIYNGGKSLGVMKTEKPLKHEELAGAVCKQIKDESFLPCICCHCFAFWIYAKRKGMERT